MKTVFSQTFRLCNLGVYCISLCSFWYRGMERGIEERSIFGIREFGQAASDDRKCRGIVPRLLSSAESRESKKRHTTELGLPGLQCGGLSLL